MESTKQRAYFKFIELLAYWQGGINSTELAQQFSISTEQAKKQLSAYRKKHKDNLEYDSSFKKFAFSNPYQLFYLSENAAEYLEWLHYPHSFMTSDRSRLHTQIVFTPERNVSHLVMQGIVTAIQKKLRLDVNYVSLSNPCAEGRVIQPLTLVKTGMRWHLRAYDEKHKEFRDFVLNRFHGKPELMDKQTVTLSEDKRWCTEQVLIFEPDTRLSEKQKNVIELDYSMQNGSLTVVTRQALVQYVLQEMQINPVTVHMIPEGQQLVLKNYLEVKHLLF